MVDLIKILSRDSLHGAVTPCIVLYVRHTSTDALCVYHTAQGTQSKHNERNMRHDLV